MKFLNNSLQQTFLHTYHFSNNSLLYHHHKNNNNNNNNLVFLRLMLSCNYGLVHEHEQPVFVKSCYAHQGFVVRKFLLNQLICSSPSWKFCLSLLTWSSASKYEVLIQTCENIYRNIQNA